MQPERSLTAAVDVSTLIERNVSDSPNHAIRVPGETVIGIGNADTRYRSHSICIDRYGI